MCGIFPLPDVSATDASHIVQDTPPREVARNAVIIGASVAGTESLELASSSSLTGGEPAVLDAWARNQHRLSIIREAA